MLEQFEQESIDKGEPIINPGLLKQMESSDIHDYKNLTPEMLENYIINLIDNEEKNKLAWDDIKDQLNEDKPIIYDGQFTKEMFLEFCEELSNPQKIRRQDVKANKFNVFRGICRVYKTLRTRTKRRNRYN